MIAFISLIYASFYLLFFNKLKLFEKSGRNITVFVGVGVILIAAIVFSWWSFAPTSADARVFRFVIPIVPNVKGPVIDVPVEPLVKLQKGELLFQIDPEPYQYRVDQLKASIEQAKAQKRLAEIQVDRARGLVKASAGAQSELDRWNAELAIADASIANFVAQLNTAQWELDSTSVRAPDTGTIINLQLREGGYVTSIPAMASMTFVSDYGPLVIASVSQSASRYIQLGDPIEIVFTFMPGKVFSGTVNGIARMSGGTQLAPSGQLPTMTGQPETGRWAVRAELQDSALTKRLPQSAAGTMAIYTDRGKPFHIISKVVMRMQAWLGT